MENGHVELVENDESDLLQSMLEKLLQQSWPLPRLAKRQKFVSLPGARSVSETEEVKTKSGLAVEKADFALLEMTETE